MYRGEEVLLFDFSGGMASATFSTSFNPKEANYLRNVYIRVGNGLEKRRGNTVFNSSAMASGAAATSLESIKFNNGNEFFVSTAGAKIYEGNITGSTMTDITGSVTITSSQNNIWTIAAMNNLAIGVGGAPDAPWKWSGSGNAAALGGSPPTGNFGFQQNNRFFIGAISGDTSLIQWSILSNPEDWSSAGSGSAYVWKDDGDSLVGQAILSDDVVLLFKHNSTHQMIGRSAPFPITPLFRDVGACGKKAIVVAYGLCYFITPYGRMLITDGTTLIDEKTLPSLMNVDDVWQGLNMSRLQYIEGRHYVGLGFDHIIWLCSSGTNTSNDLAIVWDIRNKCWLQHTTGYKGAALTRTQAGTLYMGAYDGKIYQQDISGKYIDDSETSPGAIDGYWRSGWLTAGKLKLSKHPSTAQIIYVSQTTGTLNFGYGFDYANDKIIETRAMVASGGALWNQVNWNQFLWSGQTDLFKTIFLKGRGNVFEFSFRNANPSETFQIHGVGIGSKRSAQKVMEAV